MFKFAAAVIDFYDSPEFLANAEVQQLIKTAALVPPDKVHQLKDTDFAVKVATAVGVHRKFPIYNSAATMFSGCYFQDAGENLPDPIRKVAGFFLKEAHQRFGLPLPPSLQENFPEVDRNGVEWRPETPTVGVTSAKAVVKLAEQVFMDNVNSMDLLEKVAKANEISAAAKAAGLEPTEREILDYTPKDSIGPHFKDMLIQRETLIKASGDVLLKTAWDGLLETVSTTPIREIPFLVHQFDKIAGLEAKYNAGIIDPYLGTWGGFGKVAGPQDDIMRYKLETLTRGDGSEAILATFGEALASKFLRDPVGTYPTLRPAERKFIDVLLDRVPTKDPPQDKFPPGGGKAKKNEAAKELEDARADVAKEQDSPSKRPDRGMPYKSVWSVLEEGL